MHITRNQSIRFRFLPTLVCALVVVFAAHAQEAKEAPKLEIIQTMPELVRDPAQSPGLTIGNQELRQPAVPVPEVPEAQRVLVEKELAWFKFVEDPGPVRSEEQNKGEYMAYSHLVSFAAKQDSLLLAKYSKKNVPYRNLVLDVRSDYYLDLIHLEGRLRRLTSMKATQMLINGGIETIYEGWLFPTEVYNPVCILFTELPPGFVPDQDIDRWVSFDGYFFKLMHYESGEKVGKVEDDRYRRRKAPLLMGKTVVPVATPEGTSMVSFGGAFVPMVVVAIMLIVLAIIGFAVYFARADKKFKSKMIEHQTSKNPFAGPNLDETDYTSTTPVD